MPHICWGIKNTLMLCDHLFESICLIIWFTFFGSTIFVYSIIIHEHMITSHNSTFDMSQFYASYSLKYTIHSSAHTIDRHKPLTGYTKIEAHNCVYLIYNHPFSIFLMLYKPHAHPLLSIESWLQFLQLLLYHIEFLQFILCHYWNPLCPLLLL